MTDLMTPEQRNAARARCKAATDGPWVDISGGDRISHYPFHVVKKVPNLPPWFIADIHGDLEPAGGDELANAALIAQARTDLPLALDTIDALEATLAERDAEIERLQRALTAQIEVAAIRAGSEKEPYMDPDHPPPSFPDFDWQKHGFADVERWANQLTDAALNPETPNE